MKACIHKLINQNDLTQVETYDLFSQFSKALPEQQASVIALLRTKGETFEEILAARNYLFEHTKQINFEEDVVDIVGTGGDGIGTFNISTAASLVIASCDVFVAKHSGNSVTSLSGSADVITHLGIKLIDNSEDIISSLQRNHYACMRAALFNSKFKDYANFRKNIGFPSIFNILGPLLNPIQPKKQVIGVYRKDLIKPVATFLKHTGSKRALVVHSEDGLDELGISAPTHIAELKEDHIVEYTVTPGDAGLPLSALHEVLGGTPAENAKIITDILSGTLTGPKLDIVLLNSAAGLVVADVATTLAQGVKIAREAIESGKTLELLNKLKL